MSESAARTHRLHLGRLQRQLSRLARAGRRPRRRPIDLNLDDLALNNLGLLLDPHANRAAEGLRQRLCEKREERKRGREW